MRVRAWHLETIGAMALLAILAAVFSPAAPAPLSARQSWAARSAPVILALSQDIAALQAALPTLPAESGPVLPPAAAGGLLSLQSELRRAQAIPRPPDPELDRGWRAALDQAEAAVRILAGLTSGSQPPASAAANDLDQAGQELIAVATAARAGTALTPH